jgi:hypothetical protein
MFQSPFTLILAGPTGSGKTQWLIKFLKHHRELIKPPPAKILYCYGELNETIMGLKKEGIETYNGIPDLEKIKNQEKPLLLILDDLMLDMKSEFLDLLFTRGSHNWNTSILFVTQSIFGKNIRTARANAHILVIMRSPSAQLQARTIGQQLFPRRLNYFMDAWTDATKEPFSYIVINMHPSAPEYLRLSTDIFPGEVQKIYLPIDGSI